MKRSSEGENIGQRGAMGAKGGRTFDGGVISCINCEQNLQRQKPLDVASSKTVVI